MPSKGTGPANSSTKRKLSNKIDCLPKKPKVAVGLIVRETSGTHKLPPPPGPGKGKGLMMDQGPVTGKHPVLLREDVHYAFKQLSSIIKDDDYEDLGNYATEAMGETSLFSLAQVVISVPFSVLSYCYLLF